MRRKHLLFISIWIVIVLLDGFSGDIKGKQIKHQSYTYSYEVVRGISGDNTFTITDTSPKESRLNEELKSVLSKIRIKDAVLSVTTATPSIECKTFKVYFNYRGYLLSEWQKRKIALSPSKLFSTVKPQTLNATVTGYTGNAGSNPYLKELSRKRAESVAALLKQAGINEVTSEGMPSCISTLHGPKGQSCRRAEVRICLSHQKRSER